MENPDMDGTLWGGLPDDLIERVLVRLPTVNLLRMRTVCKKWRGIMASKCFLEAWSQVTSNGTYFVKIPSRKRIKSLLSFDPSIHRWRNVPISYLPPEVGFRPAPVSSSGGLICFINTKYMNDECRSVLFISNPLTKMWKELPQLIYKHRPMLVSLIMWKWPSHYKVIVGEGAGNTEIFDSIEGAWRNTGCVPNAVQDVSLEENTYCNGSLYCLTPRWYNCELLAFSIQDEVWSKVKTGQLPGYRHFRNLVTCKGHIVIVGKSKFVKRHQLLSVCVWLLEWNTMKWLEVGRLPQHMLDDFLGRPASESRFHCCSHGDLIFLTNGRCPNGLLFDLAQNMWRWVEALPFLLDGFSFEPRLDSQV